MLTRLIVQILTNAVAIYVAAQLVPGFLLSDSGLLTVLTAGFVLGLINFFVRPLLKLLSFPLVLLSLGLFTIVINIAMLYLLDYALDTVSLSGLTAAFWATLVISAVNIIIGFFSKN